MPFWSISYRICWLVYFHCLRVFILFGSITQSMNKSRITSCCCSKRKKYIKINSKMFVRSCYVMYLVCLDLHSFYGARDYIVLHGSVFNIIMESLCSVDEIFHVNLNWLFFFSFLLYVFLCRIFIFISCVVSISFDYQHLTRVYSFTFISQSYHNLKTFLPSCFVGWHIVFVVKILFLVSLWQFQSTFCLCKFRKCLRIFVCIEGKKIIREHFHT